MRKEIVTLGGIKSIKLKFGKDIFEKLREIGQEKVNVEFRIIFESKDDKIFKLITDYIHLMNRRICERNINQNGNDNIHSCILCETIIQECETKNGKKKFTILLSKSDDLEILSDEISQQNGDISFHIKWNVRDKQKHYELVGLLSQSIISEFVFPTSILQYSNSRLFLTLTSSVTQKFIWSSNTFLMSNFVKYKNIDSDYNHNNQDTLIYLTTLQNENVLYIYNESKNRVINKNQINLEGIKKFKVKEMIERSIKLHRVLVKYRRQLENYHSIKVKCGHPNPDKLIIINHDSFQLSNINNHHNHSNNNNNINHDHAIQSYINENYDINHPKMLEDDDSDLIRLKKLEKVREQENIKEYIKVLKNKHNEYNELIQQSKIEMEKSIVQINELNQEIDLYRNDLINKVSYCIYPITYEKKTSNMKIRNILLPLINVIQNLDNKQDLEISTSLGFSLHYLEIISNILEIPSPNKIIVKGSFSVINDNPLYFYPNMNKKQIIKALKFYKSIIYNILNYFNVNHLKSKKILSSNNILLMLLIIKKYITNYH
ncbi:uncharacterized protein cubi_02186 [Cryptosporidium ubiquitum]|uniref:Uncharacterized protein n=1 Tax=Cryptosporidium ubiquitum TaxID=857276 RepID=A0A1J4MHL9_9CRYT|nr:uncharacterized protein cubi_02186 [Cryptosporidium ubiquitum]OII72955.1 hypothetical protein cubi_02186 [Cryptosporidium ubiquitum]